MSSPEANAIESLFSIQDKYTRGKVDYKLNKAQQFFDSNDNAFDRTRVIIAKARQKGFSSIVLAKLAIRCLGKEGTQCVCMSHEAGATQRLLDKVHYYLKHIKGPSPLYGRKSRSELYFQKTESSYYIGTAGAKAFGRGDCVTDLHCSEYAYWDDPVRHSTGLFQAVPQNGRIYIESTGNGRNNDFYYMWVNAERMGYKRLFYSWFFDEEYSLALPNNMISYKPDTPQHNAYLKDIQKRNKIKDTQMYWYEMKLRELRENLSLMQQEYPSEPEECFQATGGAIFPEVNLSISSDWVEQNERGYYISKLNTHPIKDYHYVIGADPSGGTGHDDAAFNIFCCETFEQVYEFYNNHTNPIAFADLLCIVAKTYNDAYIIPEANNHGAAVVPYLIDNYIKNKIYKRQYGTKTTSPKYGWLNGTNTKHALIGTMQENLTQLTIYGIQTIKELKSFEETEDGKLNGRSDNLVIATGLAMLGLKKFEYLRNDYLNPSIKVKEKERNCKTICLDDILKNIQTMGKGRRNNQIGEGYPNTLN